MTLRIVIFLISALTTFVVRAQVVFNVDVKSASGSRPIEGADVIAYNSPQLLPKNVVAVGWTDASGNASLNLNHGRYFLRVSSLGFEDIIDSIHTDSESYIVLLNEDPYEFAQAVVTVQYRKRSAENAIERVKIIDSKALESRSVVNLGEALQQQLNIQIRQDNSTGSSMSIMGISGQNVKILIDGVPVIGRLDGNIDLSQINMNDIERIEVIEGPLSTTYGSNALAGVINIITKKNVRKKQLLGVETYYEAVGQYNAAFRAGKQFGKSSVRLSGGRNFFGGFTPGDSGRWDLWKPKEQYFGRFQFNRTQKNVTIGLKTEYFNELLLNRGRPLAPYGETAFDEKFFTTRLDGKLSINWKISQIARFQAFVAANDFDRKRLKYFRNLVKLTEEPLTRNGASDTTGFTVWMSRGTFSRTPIRHRLSYEVGYDINLEKGTGLRLKDRSQSISDFALFSTAEWAINSQFQLKPGLRVSYNSVFRAPVVPMISMRYKRDKYTYRLSYSKGFRAPDLKELYIDFVDINHNVIGNIDLSPERSNHVLLSIDGKRTWKKWLLIPSISAYHNDINNKITLANTTGTVYTYVNISEFRTSGSNIKIAAVRNKLKCSLGYSYTFIESLLGNEDPVNRNYHEVNSSLSQETRIGSINLFVKYTGKQNLFVLDTETNEVEQRTTGDFTMVDLQLSKRMLQNKLTINAGVKNLMNVQNINNIVSGGAHSSGSTFTPIGTGRNPFIKLIWEI